MQRSTAAENPCYFLFGRAIVDRPLKHISPRDTVDLRIEFSIGALLPSDMLKSQMRMNDYEIAEKRA
jgi:hypothetical protein